MKNKNVWQAIKFTLFSISAGIIQILSFTLLHEVLVPAFMNSAASNADSGALFFSLTADQINQGVSYFISLVLSVVWNFTFNRRYTFHSAANVPRAMTLVALFYLVFTPLSLWWSAAFVGIEVSNDQLKQALPWLVEGGTMLVNFITEFLYQRFVVYRGSIDTNDLARKEKG